MDQARIESDREKRQELFSEIQKNVAEDLPYISLWFRDNVSVHRNRISNLELTPSGDYDFLRNIEAQVRIRMDRRARGLFFHFFLDGFADGLFGNYAFPHDGPVVPFEFDDGGR